MEIHQIVQFRQLCLDMTTRIFSQNKKSFCLKITVNHFKKKNTENKKTNGNEMLLKQTDYCPFFCC
jgi:hypothetical protein